LKPARPTFQTYVDGRLSVLKQWEETIAWQTNSHQQWLR